MASCNSDFTSEIEAKDLILSSLPTQLNSNHYYISSTLGGFNRGRRGRWN